MSLFSSEYLLCYVKKMSYINAQILSVNTLRTEKWMSYFVSLKLKHEKRFVVLDALLLTQQDTMGMYLNVPLTTILYELKTLIVPTHLRTFVH